MPTLPVVENPRRKKRRSAKYTRKQVLAGFAGKTAQARARGRRGTTTRRTSTRKTVSVRRNPRQNPTMATITNPRRRYRNPAIPGIGGINFQDAAFVAGGIVGTKVGPGLIAKVWPGVPREGISGMAVKAGVTVILGMATQMLTKSTVRRNQVVAGGIAILLVDLWDMYAAPALGLSGISGYSPAVTTSALRRIAYNNPGIAGYNTQPIRQMSTVSRQQMLAA